jgi:hypothetical protein
MLATRDPLTDPTASEFLEGVAFYPIALVVSAAMCPGLTLCIPALIFGAALILIPVVAVALILGAVAAIVIAPFALVRAVRGLRERRAESRRKARLVPGYAQPIEIGG